MKIQAKITNISERIGNFLRYETGCDRYMKQTAETINSHGRFLLIEDMSE